jgi:hypothetical protein
VEEGMNISILIIFFMATNSDGGVSSAQVEFNNMPACLAAKQQVEIATSKDRTNYGYNHRAIAVCAWKGEK